MYLNEMVARLDLSLFLLSHLLLRRVVLSLCLHFLVEVHQQDAWEALHSDLSIIMADKPGWLMDSFFFAEDALFPLQPGLPDDLSVDYRDHTLIYNIQDTAWTGWIDFSELCIPLWATEIYWLWSWAPREAAMAFQDGNLLEPVDLLKRLGITPQGFASRPIQNFEGLNPRKDWLQVTWRTRLSALASGFWPKLNALAESHSHQKLRLIMGLG